MHLDERNIVLIECFTVARLDLKISWLMPPIATEYTKPVGTLYLIYLKNHLSCNRYVNVYNVHLDERNNVLIECFTVAPLDLKI